MLSKEAPGLLAVVEEAPLNYWEMFPYLFSGAHVITNPTFLSIDMQ